MATDEAIQFMWTLTVCGFSYSININNDLLTSYCMSQPKLKSVINEIVVRRSCHTTISLIICNKNQKF